MQRPTSTGAKDDTLAGALRDLGQALALADGLAGALQTAVQATLARSRSHALDNRHRTSGNARRRDLRAEAREQERAADHAAVERQGVLLPRQINGLLGMFAA